MCGDGGHQRLLEALFYLLEEGLTVMLVNAHDARNVPGRKTDVSDAAWLADLGARRPRLSLSQHVV